MKRLLALVVLAALPALAAEQKAPPYIVSIGEIPQNGGELIPCASTAPDCSADILSTLDITPNLANVPQHAVSSATGAGADEAVDQQRRAHLNDALRALNESLALSRQIIERRAAGAGPEALNPLSRAFAEQQVNVVDNIVKVLALDPGNAGKSRRELERTLPLQSPAEIGQWLADRIRTLDQSSMARLAAGTAGLQLRLAAARVRGGTTPMPVHLPGYDTYDPLSATPIQRITFNVDSAERARNAADVQATAALVNLIRTNFKALTDSYKKELDDAKAKVNAARASLDSAAVRSGDLSVPLAALTKELNDAAAIANEPLKSKLTKTATDVNALGALVQSTLTAITGAQQTLTAVPSKLDSSALNVAAGRPDLVLDNVLSTASGAQASLTNALAALRTARESLLPRLSDVEADLRALGASTPADAAPLMARLRSDLLAAVVSPIEQLQATQLILSALRGSASDPVKTAGPVVDLQAPQVLTVSNPMPTRLEIARTDPRDNDVIDIAAQVLDGANKVIYEEHRSVRVRFYGWHSGLASGLVFVRAQETAQENLKPEAAAIWRIVRTPRPWEDNWRQWYFKVRPAVGFHSTTLHFGNDNNSVQFGLGVSAHLFNDLFQLGYGWNLGVTKNRGYGYLGLGVMQLLRSQLTGLSSQ
jgi:hypothetical protein